MSLACGPVDALDAGSVGSAGAWFDFWEGPSDGLVNFRSRKTNIPTVWAECPGWTNWGKSDPIMMDMASEWGMLGNSTGQQLEEISPGSCWAERHA